MSEPIEEENPTFERADEVLLASKATQTIIPGAAYLWNDTVVLGNVDDFNETPFVVDADGNTSYPVPDDLILLYAPGDDVYKRFNESRRWETTIEHAEGVSDV